MTGISGSDQVSIWAIWVREFAFALLTIRSDMVELLRYETVTIIQIASIL